MNSDPGLLSFLDWAGRIRQVVQVTTDWRESSLGLASGCQQRLIRFVSLTFISPPGIWQVYTSLQFECDCVWNFLIYYHISNFWWEIKNFGRILKFVNLILGHLGIISGSLGNHSRVTNLKPPQNPTCNTSMNMRNCAWKHDVHFQEFHKLSVSSFTSTDLLFNYAMVLELQYFYSNRLNGWSMDHWTTHRISCCWSKQGRL